MESSTFQHRWPVFDFDISFAGPDSLDQGIGVDKYDSVCSTLQPTPPVPANPQKVHNVSSGKFHSSQGILQPSNSPSSWSISPPTFCMAARNSFAYSQNMRVQPAGCALGFNMWSSPFQTQSLTQKGIYDCDIKLMNVIMSYLHSECLTPAFIHHSLIHPGIHFPVGVLHVSFQFSQKKIISAWRFSNTFS